MDGLYSMTREQRCKGPGKISVEQDTHARFLRGRCDQRLLRDLEDGDGVLPSDAREIVQELVERVPRLEIFDQRPHRHPGPREDRRAAETIGGAGDQVRVGRHDWLQEVRISIYSKR